MADSRTSRDLSSRDKSARIVYTPSSTLPDPTPEPGYTYRWIATHVLGQGIPTNVSSKMRDGWVPVKAADHEELMLVGNEKTGNVEIGAKLDSADKRYTTRFAIFQSTKFNERNTDPDSAATAFLLSGKRHTTGLELDVSGTPTGRTTATTDGSIQISKCFNNPLEIILVSQLRSTSSRSDSLSESK
jgi:outer membrane receptor protein involved in Fe transport